MNRRARSAVFFRREAGSSRRAHAGLVPALTAMGVVATLGGCASPDSDPPASTGDDPLSLASLWSGAYRVEALGDTAVPFSDGLAQGLRPDGGVAFSARILPLHARGDIDADGADEGAIIVQSETGGSGVFVDLILVRADASRPRQVGALFLGDRVQVESLSVEAGSVVATVLGHDEEDPLCCPTRSVVRRFAWETGDLAEVDLPYMNVDVSSAAASVGAAAAAGEDWVTDPLQVGLRAAGPLTGSTSRIARRSAPGELPDRVELVIEESGLLDDSVRGRRVEVTVERDARGAWEPTRGRIAWACWPGRGHTFFAAVPCS